MRVSKKQLRRIIKEEKSRLLNEQITDMEGMEEAIGEPAEAIASKFGELMMELFREEPEAFAGRSTEAQWEQQVYSAEAELVQGIIWKIEDEVQRVESMLHDGQFLGQG